MKSYLTGNPEIRLALNDDLLIGKGGRSIYGTESYTVFVTLCKSIAFMKIKELT